MYGIKGRLRISKTTLPIYMETITAQKISGRSTINRGPGATFSASNAPSNIAVVPEPGIPSVSKGTNDPVQAALLAASGAANPLIEPLPNSACSSPLAMLRFADYPVAPSRKVVLHHLAEDETNEQWCNRVVGKTQNCCQGSKPDKQQ